MRELGSQKLAELFRIYESGMYDTAYDILGDDLLAEQAVGNAFTKISGQLHKIKETEHFKSQEYMYETIVDAAMQLEKAQQKQVWLFEFVEEDNWEEDFVRREKFIITGEEHLFSEQYLSRKRRLLEDIEIGEKKPHSILKRIIKLV